MSTKDVFISYKSEEFDDALWVKSTLENNGISCWMAPMDITGGSSYAAEIPQAIRNCKIFVLILSNKSQTSKWVPRELDQAINVNKIIMPFMLEDCTLKDDFNFYLTNVQRYAAYESKSKALERMISEIRAILGIQLPEQNTDKKDIPNEKISETKGEFLKSDRKKAPKKQQKELTGKSSNKKERKPLFKLGIAALVIIVLVSVSVILSNATHFYIAGERYSVSETYISIRNTELTDADIQNIGKLNKVRSIRFENCTISVEDISVLSISELQSLYLNDCNLTTNQINSIDFSCFSNLSVLYLNGNSAISTLDMLLEVSDTLTTLNISDTGISDITKIFEFSKLTNFYCDNNSISDISALSSCGDLKELSLNGNKITDLSALSECSKLTNLYVNGNLLTSLSGLEQSISLKEIQAGSNEITSLGALSNATVLQFVFLNDNIIADISVLGKSAQTLKNVYLRNNLVKNIEALSSCSSLNYLNIDNNLVASLQPLSGCTELIGVSASGNRIASVAGLDNKEKLTYLNLSNNNIVADVNAKLSFSSSEQVSVELSGNELSYIDLPLYADYKYLGLHGNSIADFEPLYSMQMYILVIDYSDKIDFTSLSTSGTTYYKIVDCPLDKQIAVSESLGSAFTEFITASDCEELTESHIRDNIKGVVEYYI